MPLILDIEKPHFQLKVWHITEGVSFFEKNMQLFPSEKKHLLKIKIASKILEWLASRYISKSLIDNKEIIKDEFGKPHLKSRQGYISLSHCEKYAVAIYSKEFNVGIDIEPQRVKVKRIAKKFLNTEEINFIEKNLEIKHLITCWAMKEAAYKWYGKKYIAFKNIVISPYKYNENLSRIRVKLHSKTKTYSLKAFHIEIDNHSLVFCFAKKDLKNLDLSKNLHL